MNVIHISVLHKRGYAALACLAIDSLIRKGSVKPHRIIVTIHKSLLKTPEGEWILKSGVLIVSVTVSTWSNKFLQMDQIFKAHPNVSAILQWDSDCILLEPCNIIEKLDKGFHGISLYGNPREATLCFKDRASAWIPAFAWRNGQEEMSRLCATIKALFRLDSYSDAIAGTTWFHGGVMFVPREAFIHAAWEKMVAIAWICASDEVVISLGSFAGLALKYIPENVLPHYFQPIIGDALERGKGIMHLAGSVYRKQYRPQIRRLLAALMPVEGDPFEGDDTVTFPDGTSSSF